MGRTEQHWEEINQVFPRIAYVMGFLTSSEENIEEIQSVVSLLNWTHEAFHNLCSTSSNRDCPENLIDNLTKCFQNLGKTHNPKEKLVIYDAIYSDMNELRIHIRKQNNEYSNMVSRCIGSILKPIALRIAELVQLT